ncbi:MAG TPA: hypothetical protein PKA88_24520 [Polyangiaceae bacterium]|nr:hypothetical protein [Polyangiaceae bacterium]HMR81082.1 hypothetical protein [Polyangiaceae bacterium]
MIRTALWLFCIGTLASCAPMERTEVKTVLSSHRLPQRVCKWEPRMGVSRVPSGLLVSVSQQRTCRFVEEREVRTDVSTRPNMGVFLLESAATFVGGVLIANAFVCDANKRSSQSHEGGGERGSECIDERLMGWLGVAIVVPAGTATIVDVFDFFGGETRVGVEHRPLPGGAEVYEERAVRGVMVTLELGDGGTLSSVSDELGIATFPLSPDALEGELRVGKLSRRVLFPAP